MKSASQCYSAKLPKLVLSKFEGTHMDWQRFWGVLKRKLTKQISAQSRNCRTSKNFWFPKHGHLLMCCPSLRKGMKSKNYSKDEIWEIK